VVLSILGALGVNIVPLLAGASVFGLAIGFGSQALVRDIVSGAFFLMDDAFLLGEYIEAGDAKGTIERITIRSLRRGPPPEEHEPRLDDHDDGVPADLRH
jgi:small-conductance mechanosensitive channel